MSEIVAMVLGFIVFWPIGLAVLAWKKNWFGLRRVWNGRLPEEMRRHAPAWAMVGPQTQDIGNDTGNTAFESFKKAELERLQAEFEALAARQRAFEDFLTRLRLAKDQEEFDRFLREGEARAA